MKQTAGLCCWDYFQVVWLSVCCANNIAARKACLEENACDWRTQ